MARKFGFRPSAAQMKRQTQAIMEAMITDPAQLARWRAENPAAAPKRERAAPRQLEAPVVAGIADLLAVHPRVLFAVRQNTGAASYEAATGRYAPVYFYKILTGQPMTITDFWGLLRDGRPFAIEAKAPGWKAPKDDRERRQWAFLAMIRNCGGAAGFATSVEEAKAILDGD